MLKSGRKVYDVKVSIKGIQYLKRGLRTKEAAINWQRTMMDMRDGLYSRLTVEELAWLWLEDCIHRGLAPLTIVDYRLQLGLRILPATRHLKIGEVRPPQLQEIINKASKQYRSAQKTGVVLHSMFSAAVRWGLLDSSPADHLRAPGHKKEEMTYLTHEQGAALLRAAEGDMELYVLIGLSTGMRPGEIRALRWEDVEGRKIRIRQAKTAAGRRTVIIPTQLAATLAARKDKGHLFTVDGRPWTGYNLRWRFRQALAAANLLDKGITPHSLRHTFVAWYISETENINLKWLSKTLGHTDHSFTLREYGHLFDSRAEEITDSFQAVSNLYHEGSKQEGNIIEFPQ